MNEITISDKKIHINLDTEEIFFQHTSENLTPLVAITGTDQNNLKYELHYTISEKCLVMSRKIFSDEIEMTPKLMRIVLNLYEEITHESYCDWENPTYYRKVSDK